MHCSRSMHDALELFYFRFSSVFKGENRIECNMKNCEMML